jgi:hypothetical protein
MLVIVAGLIASVAGGSMLLRADRAASVTSRGVVPVTANSRPPLDGIQPADRSVQPAKWPHSGLAAPPATLRLGSARLPIDPAVLTAQRGMQLPATVYRVAWWSYGAAPGDARGTAVLAGHVDTRDEGMGPLASLAALQPGDPVGVTDHAGVDHEYVVKALRSYPSRRLPGDLFTTADAPRLALITCAGEWNPRTRAYQHNLVVWAVPSTHPSSNQ